MSTPASQINICRGVRLDNTYRNTIYFSSISGQLSYFLGKVVKTFTGYTYLRKSWSIKVSATMAQANSWTYLFFSNGEGQKTWYYFINNIEYVNDNTVELFLELDVMQTYMFDYTLLPSFVEREHVTLDAIGSNTIDEGLEVGELMTITSEEIDLNDWYIMILASADPALSQDSTAELTHTYGALMDGVFSGLAVYAYPAGEASSLGTILNKLDEAGNTDIILAMWMYPGELFSKGSASAGFMFQVSGSKSVTHSTERNSTLFGGYTPNNKKLYCYPYNFLYVTDNNGGAAAYPYEYFGDATSCNFKIVGSVSPEAKVRMYPLNFKGAQHNYEEGLTLAGYPSCSWDSDPYKLWLAQNQNSNNMGLAMAGLKILGGAALAVSSGGLTMAAGGASIVSGVTDIAGQLAQRADRDIQPPQAKGSFSASTNITAGFQTFTLKKKSVSREQAIRIDDFFSMYGYACKSVKVPNRAARENWSYIKTAGCNISGNLCKEDAAKICAVYDSGVTFWKNGDSVGNYALSNNPTP